MSEKLQKLCNTFFNCSEWTFTLPGGGKQVIMWSNFGWNLQPVMWILCGVRLLQSTMKKQNGGPHHQPLTLAVLIRFTLQGPQQATNSWWKMIFFFFWRKSLNKDFSSARYPSQTAKVMENTRTLVFSFKLGASPFCYIYMYYKDT